VTTYLQRTTPPRLLGRVLANVYGGVGVAAAAGYLIGGPIVDGTSPRTAFVVVGCGGLAGAAITAVLLRRARLRRLQVTFHPAVSSSLAPGRFLDDQAGPGGVHHGRKGINMKSLKAALAALPVLAALFLLPAARAATVSSGSGSFTTTGDVISVRHADGNTIVTATEVQAITGVLNGIRRAEGIEIFHPDGTFTAHDSGTFTGTVDGRTGSLTISGASSGVGNTGSGQLVGDRGTGGLAGLHLHGTFHPVITGSTTAEGTYSVQFHFDS
jgi:hypothetical protein